MGREHDGRSEACMTVFVLFCAAVSCTMTGAVGVWEAPNKR